MSRNNSNLSLKKANNEIYDFRLFVNLNLIINIIILLMYCLNITLFLRYVTINMQYIYKTITSTFRFKRYKLIIHELMYKFSKLVTIDLLID